MDVCQQSSVKAETEQWIKGSNRHLCLTLATNDIKTNAFAVVKGTNTEYPSYQFAQKMCTKNGETNKDSPTPPEQ